MWFLELKKLLMIIGFSLGVLMLRTIKSKLYKKKNSKKDIINIIIPMLEMFIIGIFSKKLLVFYLIYITVTYILSFILYKVVKFRKQIFALFSLISIIPFFASRLFGEEGNFFIIIGIAYAIFKVIDIFYNVYYTNEKIDLITYINYILFLPTFTAGPVHKYREFKDTLEKPLNTDISNLAFSTERIIKGLFKKIVLVQIVTKVFGYLLLSEKNIYMSIAIIFTSYILLYLDLSGYSDIAIGLGYLSGLKVPENFKKPWEAPSMTQFWRNWHVTISDFIREHIYVLVAKKNLNKFQGGLIGLITMIIMAMWHGFNKIYLLSGIYLGIILFLENIFSLTTLNKRKANKLYFWSRCFLTNFLFGINTLVFMVPRDKVIEILKGLVRL